MTPEICPYVVDDVDADADAPWEHVADEGWQTSVWVLLGGDWQTSAPARVDRVAFLLESYLNKMHR